MSALDVRQIEDGDIKRARFPSVRQELRLVISEKAFDRAVARGEEDTTREIGGVLVGELLRDESGPFLRIDDTIDALHADEKGAELTFTHATWEHIHKEMDSSHADKKIVGWYHTHPGFGIFLSDRDQFIHSSFFNLPFQIALVYDPKTREHGVFAWRDGEPARCRRYWVGDREHTWDGTRVAAVVEDAAPKSAKVVVAESASAAPAKDARDSAAAGLSDWKATAATGVLLALAGIVGGYWYGTRAASDVIRQVEVELSRARAEGVRAAVSDIDAQLLGVLRGAIGNEPTRRRVEQALAELDEADKALAGEKPNAAAAVEKVKGARDKLRELRDDRGDAQTALARLEDVARQASLSPAEVTREIGTLRSALGALHAELATDAARAGDVHRADRLLTVAGNVDQGNRSRYEQQRAALASGKTSEAATPPGSGVPLRRVP